LDLGIWPIITIELEAIYSVASPNSSTGYARLRMKASATRRSPQSQILRMYRLLDADKSEHKDICVLIDASCVICFLPNIDWWQIFLLPNKISFH